MQNIRKIFKSRFWENCVTNQQANQPIITNNIDFLGPGWRRSKNFSVFCWLKKSVD